MQSLRRVQTRAPKWLSAVCAAAMLAVCAAACAPAAATPSAIPATTPTAIPTVTPTVAPTPLPTATVIEKRPVIPGESLSVGGVALELLKAPGAELAKYVSAGDRVVTDENGLVSFFAKSEGQQVVVLAQGPAGWMWDGDSRTWRNGNLVLPADFVPPGGWDAEKKVAGAKAMVKYAAWVLGQDGQYRMAAFLDKGDGGLEVFVGDPKVTELAAGEKVVRSDDGTLLKVVDASGKIVRQMRVSWTGVNSPEDAVQVGAWVEVKAVEKPKLPEATVPKEIVDQLRKLGLMGEGAPQVWCGGEKYQYGTFDLLVSPDVDIRVLGSVRTDVIAQAMTMMFRDRPDGRVLPITPSPDDFNPMRDNYTKYKGGVPETVDVTGKRVTVIIVDRADIQTTMRTNPQSGGGYISLFRADNGGVIVAIDRKGLVPNREGWDWYDQPGLSMELRQAGASLYLVERVLDRIAYPNLRLAFSGQSWTEQVSVSDIEKTRRAYYDFLMTDASGLDLKSKDRLIPGVNPNPIVPLDMDSTELRGS